MELNIVEGLTLLQCKGNLRPCDETQQNGPDVTSARTVTLSRISKICPHIASLQLVRLDWELASKYSLFSKGNTVCSNARCKCDTTMPHVLSPESSRSRDVK